MVWRKVIGGFNIDQLNKETIAEVIDRLKRG
jgi:hypothetical protein